MKKNTILFDLDGTLIESGKGIIAAAKYMLEKMHHPPLTEKQLRSFIGPPVTQSMRNLFHFTEEERPQAMAYYREYYLSEGLKTLAVYPGVLEMLEALKGAGYRLAVATCKLEDTAISQTRQLGIFERVDLVCGGRIDIGRVEKADVIREVMRRLNITPADGVMVGDRKFDLEGANVVGMDSVGVLYGYGDREELEAYRPVRIVETVEALRAYFM
jgi:phosphoglycolate phosphatase